MRNWMSYWSANPKAFVKVMDRSTEYFSKKLRELKLVNRADVLLDYGCGPGNLAYHLNGFIGSYYGVDISETYIEQATNKMSGNKGFIFYRVNDEDPIGNLEKCLGYEEQFDTIVVLSVIQYFESINSVENLLAHLKVLLKPNGKIIIADVLANEDGVWKDLWSNLIHSCKNGYAITFFWFLVRLKFTQYNRLKKTYNLLHIPDEIFLDMCKKLKMNCTILPKITLQKSRNSFCITL